MKTENIKEKVGFANKLPAYFCEWSFRDFSSITLGCIRSCPNALLREQLIQLEQEFSLMNKYWSKDIEDPQLEQNMQSFSHRLVALCGNIKMSYWRENPLIGEMYKSAMSKGLTWNLEEIRKTLEDFLTENAMLELEPPHVQKDKRKAFNARHFDYLKHLSEYIITGDMWTANDQRQMADMLTSPLIDSFDAQTVTAAIVVSLFNQYDYYKRSTLLHVYQHATDEYVRQRALVGYVLGSATYVPDVFPRQYAETRELLQSDAVVNELFELQFQVIYTLCTVRDRQKCKDDMDAFLKNNPFFRQFRNKDTDEPSQLDDILNSEDDEEKLMKIESSVKKYMNEQLEVNDIYYSALRSLMNNPFFDEPANWLMPFSLQHPGLQVARELIAKNPNYEFLFHNLSLCNIDTCCFVLGSEKVMRAMPEYQSGIMGQLMNELKRLDSQKESNMSESIRRNFLKDLFRFYNAYKYSHLFDHPFDEEADKQIPIFLARKTVSHTPLAHLRNKVAQLLVKKKPDLLDTLLDSYTDDQRDDKYYYLRGDIAKAYKLNPDNEHLQICYAQKLIAQEEYDEAEEVLLRLTAAHPDVCYYTLSRVLNLQHLGKLDECLKLLYQLYYLKEDDEDVCQSLAWTLCLSGRYEKAYELYGKMVAKNLMDDRDAWMNYGLCVWAMGHRQEAISCFRKHAKRHKIESADDKEFFSSKDLTHFGFSTMEVKMMIHSIFN